MEPIKIHFNKKSGSHKAEKEFYANNNMRKSGNNSNKL